MKTSHLLSATALASALIMAPSVAWAQESTDTQDSTEAPAAQASEGESIVVVGSRIRRNKFNGADPVQVITRDEATQAGFNSTAEILQSNAITGGTDQINDTYGGFVVAGGPGVNTVSLRGLGTTRTLVLLDGRRVAPAGSRGSVGSADLNVLPNAMIDRVEVLNTGASSIYGSDAVAGVINIVTRSRVTGINLEAQHNVTEEGGGNSYRYSLTAGFQTGGFNFAGSLEYYKRDTLRVGQRDWTSCPTARYGTNGSDFGAGDFIDPSTGRPKCFPLENGGVTVNTIGTPNFAGSAVALAPGVPAGYVGTCNRFRPRAGAPGSVPGYECVGGGTLSTNIRDTGPYSKLTADLIAPAEIYTAYGKLSYDSHVLGDAEFYLDVLLNRRQSSQLGQRQFTIDYNFGSPLIPVELRYPTAFLGATATAPAVGIRVFADYGNYNNYQTVDFARINGGVRGDLPFSGWRYDLFFGKSWSDSDYTSDLILTDRFYASMDVVASGGGFACRNNTIPGCVAAPALTPGIVNGDFRSASPAWFDFVTDPITGHTSFKETTANLTLDGPLFALPGGDIAVAVGVEYRKSTIDDSPDPESVRGNLYGFTSSTPTRGSDAVWEAFGEIELPIITDSFIYNLTLNGSGRYTHYDSYGGQSTYKFGGIFSPVKGLSARGSYGTSYRAPALYEQFLGATSGFLANTGDPCNDLASVTNPLIRDRCISEGLPVGTAAAVPPFSDGFRQNSSITVIGLGGAAAGLKAETSRALTFGGVLEPSFGEDFGNFSFAADYFRINVDNGVSQLSAANVLAQCYNNIARTTCDTGLITRTPYTGPGTGTLRVIQSFVNISDAKVEGIDYTLRYSRNIGPGQLRFNAQVTQYISRYNRTFPTSAIIEQIGLIENPEFTGTFDVAYKWDHWNIRYGVEWVDATDAQAYALSQNPAFTTAKYDFTTPDYYMHSASVRYETRNFALTLGVRNLFNKAPPVISADYTNLLGNAPLYSGYDQLGRRFFVGLRAGF
ncbi:MAG: TonB-dependent receptor [Pseudomonadota bacterium]